MTTAHATILSVIVPTYNERDSLPHLVARLAEVAGRTTLEVVVVDDASPDGTGLMAENLARQGSLPIVVLHRASKAGLASAVVEGARSAQGDVLTVMDADLSHPPELLPELAAAVQSGADIAVASRYVSGGGVEAWPVLRRAVSRTATWLARVLLGLPVHDPLSGFFAVRRPMMAERQYMGIGYKLLVEVLATHPRARVVEIPYRFVERARGQSKLTFGEIWAFLKLLVRLRTLKATEST